MKVFEGLVSSGLLISPLIKGFDRGVRALPEFRLAVEPCNFFIDVDAASK